MHAHIYNNWGDYDYVTQTVYTRTIGEWGFILNYQNISGKNFRFPFLRIIKKLRGNKFKLLLLTIIVIIITIIIHFCSYCYLEK